MKVFYPIRFLCKDKITALLAAFCLFAVTVHGRQAGPDSLRQKLKDSSLSDDARIAILLDLAWSNMAQDMHSVQSILDSALVLASARDSNYARIGDVYASLGSGYYYIDRYDSALYFYRKAETYYKKDTSDKAVGNIAANRMSMGTAFLQQGNHHVAIKAYLQAINILERAGDYSNLVTAYANTGLVYNDLKQYDKALEYHRKALHIAETHAADMQKNTRGQLLMFVSLDHLNLKQYQEAKDYLDLSEDEIKKIKSNFLHSLYYGYRGRYFYEIKEYDSSIINLHRALEFSKKANQQFQKGLALMFLGLDHFEMKQYSNSIRYLEQALVIFRKIGDKIRENRVLASLSPAYASVQNYRAATMYYEQYFRLNDSLSVSDNKKQINEIETRYQTQRKADSILVLKKSNQIQQLDLHKKKNVNKMLLAGIALLIGMGILIYRNFRHRHRIFEQNELLHAQRIRELEKAHQLVAMQSVIKGQEEERGRLARDLHDGVGGLLSGIKLSLTSMKGNVFLSEENAMAVNNVIGQLDQSIAELRRVSHNMMPEALIKFGLKEALENYCENINLSGKIKIRLQTYGMENRIDQNAEIILYRIVQELLNNIIKHAKASQVLVQLTREDKEFSLTVEDDGIGFNVEDAEKRKGAGLANVKARAEYLNGTVDIQSEPGEGTSVNIIGKLE